MATLPRGKNLNEEPGWTLESAISNSARNIVRVAVGETMWGGILVRSVLSCIFRIRQKCEVLKVSSIDGCIAVVGGRSTEPAKWILRQAETAKYRWSISAMWSGFSITDETKTTSSVWGSVTRDTSCLSVELKTCRCAFIQKHTSFYNIVKRERRSWKGSWKFKRLAHRSAQSSWDIRICKILILFGKAFMPCTITLMKHHDWWIWKMWFHWIMSHHLDGNLGCLKIGGVGWWRWTGRNKYSQGLKRGWGEYFWRRLSSSTKRKIMLLIKVMPNI